MGKKINKNKIEEFFAFILNAHFFFFYKDDNTFLNFFEFIFLILIQILTFDLLPIHVLSVTIH